MADPEKVAVDDKAVMGTTEVPAESTADEKSGGMDTLTQELSRIGTSDYPTAFPLAMIIVALVLAVLLSALDMTIVATAIPKITDEFHSLDQVGWYGSAFFLCLAAFQSTWGKAFKYFPLKTMFLLAIFIFEIGSLICAVAQNSTTLIVGRAVAGVGGAGVASGAYTIIGFSAPPAKRAAFTGIVGAAFGVASALGPLLGGIFTTHLTWRWCFWINLPIGGVSGAIILFFFTTPKAATPQQATMKEKILQMDLPGTFIIMAATICYLLAMQWGGTTKSWSDGSVIACLVLFGLLVIAFVAVEYFQKDRALLQGRLLMDRTFMGVSFYIFVVAGAFFIILYYLPIYFQALKDVSAAKSGVNNLPLVIACSVFSVISGVLISIFGDYIIIMGVGSVLGSVGAGMIYTFNINTGSSAWIGYQVLIGAGLGFVFQVPVIVAQATAKPSDLSSVSAMILFFQTIGGAIWISAAQAGFANKLLKTLPSKAPGVNPKLVVATGASELRSVFAAKDIPGVLSAYLDGLRVAFAISIALACVSTVLVLAPRRQNIKGKMQMGGA